MKDHDDDLVEGRVRRGRMLLAGAAGLALLVGLPFAVGIVSGDPPPEDAPTGPTSPSFDDVGPTGDLHGHLAYTTFETEGSLGQRLVVLDLATGSFGVGPLVPVAEELHAAGASGNQLILIADDAGARGVAFALPDLSPGGRLREVASGEVLSLSTDGTALLVGRSRPTGGDECGSHSFTLSRVDIATGRGRDLHEGRVACGNLVSATLDRDLLVASFVRDGRLEVDAIWPQNPTVLFHDLAHVSVSPRGTLLFVAPEGDLNALGVWPGTPSGPVFVWPGSGNPRPLVSDVELFAQRIVAWSADGSQVVVNGSVRGERGMWLVYVPAGTIQPVLRPGVLSRRPASSGAAFDDQGSLFAAVPGTIVIANDAGVFPLELPPDAPSPAGPLAWLP
ncbi:MAG: hypothetical protein WD965_09930 [Actinomycetota bacterium]